MLPARPGFLDQDMHSSANRKSKTTALFLRRGKHIKIAEY